MKADISIIVPVYNSSKYLKTCVDSLCEQTYTNVEIILVDDGSTDDSGEVCEGCALKDSRIKVIHQHNAGRVVARLRGLQEASAQIVMFVDSDDWVEPEICEHLYKIMKEKAADLVCCGCWEEKEGGKEKKHESFEEGLYNNEKQLMEFRENSLMYEGKDEVGLSAHLWAKIYRRDLAIAAMSEVPADMYRGEDLLYNNIYIFTCQSIFVSHQCLYHYRIHNESTVSGFCPDLLLQVGMFHNSMQKEITENGLLKERLNMRTLLNVIRLWNYEYDRNLSMRIPYYCFNFDEIRGESIILYGGGSVGKDYYWQLKKTAPKRLKLWVDKNYKKIANEKYDVRSVDEIRECEFEQVLIGVASEKTAEQIREELITQYEVPDEKITWVLPQNFWT